MTPSHLHLCISMCMYSPFTPQMQFQRTCDQILCAKRSFRHLHREGRKKRWAVSGERPDGAMWHILERSPLSPCAPLDAIRFLCQGFGPRSTVDFWEGFGKLPKKDPQKISKKSEEREATGASWIYLALKGQKFNFSKCGSNSITDRISFQGLEGNPTL